MSTRRLGDVVVDVGIDHVATVTIDRPPDNYFDLELIASIADAYEALDADLGCRAIVLRAEGRHFCAGARFGSSAPSSSDTPRAGRHLYDEAVRVFAARTPVVAAVRGSAIGGGLGLAMSADFRVGSPRTRLSANFARLGFHHGFGLTVTLPAAAGQQRALELLLTGRRIPGDEAAAIGLLDRLVSTHDDETVDSAGVDAAAHDLAAEIALSAPLAVDSIRATMRLGLVEQIRSATARERAEQERLMHTADFAEGVAATAARRPAAFEGR